jgi:hypothetical protein
MPAGDAVEGLIGSNNVAAKGAIGLTVSAANRVGVTVGAGKAVLCPRVLVGERVILPPLTRLSLFHEFNSLPVRSVNETGRGGIAKYSSTPPPPSYSPSSSFFLPLSTHYI